jgi:UDP-N-acetyl-D-mannosaminuronate dehydrogenase
MHSRRIAVIGLGYVGLPVAFARAGAPVIGFDIDESRIDVLKPGGVLIFSVPTGGTWCRGSIFW